MDFIVLQAPRQNVTGRPEFGEREIRITFSNRSEHKGANNFAFRVGVGRKVNNAEKYVLAMTNAGEVVFIPSTKGFKFVKNAPKSNTRVMRIDLADTTAGRLPIDMIERVRAEKQVRYRGEIDGEQRIWLCRDKQ